LSVLDDLRRAGVPALDEEVDRVATDGTLTLEVRQELLAERLPFVKNEADRLNIQSWLETLAMRRLAMDRVD
jgi:hypothetical protein